MQTILGRSARMFLQLAAMATGCLGSLAWADSALVTNSDNGHLYKRFDTSLTWQQARDACVSQGAHLATVNSQAENDFLTAQFIQLETESWLGGTDELSEGTWRWITGEPWTFQNWQAGEPNDLNPYEDYLQLPSVWSGLWNDAPGGQSDSVFRFSRSYICEWERERRYDSIATLSDVTGDSIPDYATTYREAGNTYLLTVNGATGRPIKRIIIGRENALVSATLSAAAGDISVLLSRSNGTAAIQVRDEVTLAVTATINIR